jgi:hypothetical protein
LTYYDKGGIIKVWSNYLVLIMSYIDEWIEDEDGTNIASVIINDMCESAADALLAQWLEQVESDFTLFGGSNEQN